MTSGNSVRNFPIFFENLSCTQQVRITMVRTSMVRDKEAHLLKILI